MNKRQFKFKFWCKGTSESPNFLKPDWWSWPNFILEKYYTPSDLFNNENFVPCQFTGLLDINGREIYENYIVKKYWKTQDANGVMRYNSNNYNAFQVKWSPQHLGFELSVGRNHYYEVIGNIFETPNLLNKP